MVLSHRPLFCREMDKNEDQIQTSSSKTLLVRHLPAELKQDEKEDLLKYFGAESVRVFSNTGRLVGCASLKLSFVTLTFIHLNALFLLHRNMPLLRPIEVRSPQQRRVK